MKQPYLYFGRKGFQATAGVVNGVYGALTNANSGMLPIAKANSVLSPSLRVLIKSTTVVADVRGSLLAALPDFVDGSDLTAATAAGEVVNVSAIVKSYTIGSGDEVVTILDVSDTSGQTVIVGDTVYLEEMNFDATVLPINTVGADLAVPASAFIAAEPLAYTEGVGVNQGLDEAGNALDATRLIFKSANKAGAAVDTVDLVHTANKYKEICEAMQDLCNSSVYEEMIKVHHLTSSGQVLHNAFSSRGIDVKRCLITRA
jgi:hypothetical protein|tara:strand:+ start:676 stop:1452 length:777 start_codon:yes stop_codon:yes gene_type:complete